MALEAAFALEVSMVWGKFLFPVTGKLESEVPLGECAGVLRSDIVVGDDSLMGDVLWFPFQPKKDDIFEIPCLLGVGGPLAP